MTIQVKRNIPLTVLLSGSVIQNHPGLLPTGIQDSRQRLFDYLCAIPLWLAQPEVDHVVYCDAGGFSFPKGIFESPKFESLTVDLKELCHKRGKDAAESMSMDYAINECSLLKDGFFKCTGRLFVRNFSEIVQSIVPIEPCFYISKDHAVTWADTRFFWMDIPRYHSAIKPHLDKMNDFEGRIAEFIYYYHGQEYRPLPTPVYIGRSGHTGQYYDEDYSESVKSKANELLRQIEHTLPEQDFTS